MSAFFNVLSVASFICCAAVVFWLVRLAIAVQELQRLRQLSSASRMESLQTSLDETNAALEALANRVKMHRVRTALNHVKDPPAEPDPYTDPDAWRRTMNKQLAFKGRPK